MERTTKLTEMHETIQLIKQHAEKLGRQGDEFPALSRNVARILASLKMLELNVSDLIE